MKLTNVQNRLLDSIKNPVMTINTIVESKKIGCDDAVLILETNEIRLKNVFNGVAITNTVNALIKKGLITVRSEKIAQFVTFYITIKE